MSSIPPKLTIKLRLSADSVPPPSTANSQTPSRPVSAPPSAGKKKSTPINRPVKKPVVTSTVPVAKWRWTWATLPTLPGISPVSVRVWAREGGLSQTPPKVTTSPTKKESTFVCTHPDCHKIFNGRDQWRRHMNMHKKGLPLRIVLPPVEEEIAVVKAEEEEIDSI